MKSRSRDGVAAKGLFGIKQVDTDKLPLCKAHILLGLISPSSEQMFLPRNHYDKGLMLEKSAATSFYDGNLTLRTLFDAKF